MSNKTKILLLLLVLAIFLVPSGQPITVDVNMSYFGPPWDVDHDGDIDYNDASLLVSRYGDTGPPDWIREDIDDNGEVNSVDASLLVNHYMEYWLVIP